MTSSPFAMAVKALSQTPDHLRMGEVIGTAQEASDHEIAALAEILATSGAVLPRANSLSVSFASTGGPSSLSTLLVPMYLQVLGFRVPALGVPGRPAGGVDVLATIPGYRVHLDVTAVNEAITACGYAHFCAGQHFAPTDAALFSYRQRVGSKSEPSLVIASLLSKTIAVGVQRMGLDVRVAPFANFGSDWDMARRNARRFARVAQILNVKATCFLTDGTFHYQPYIGRGEALVALDNIFRDVSDPDLTTHVRSCWRMAQSLAASEPSDPPSGHILRQAFDRNLGSQGSSPSAFDGRVQQISDAPVTEIRSEASGYLWVNLKTVRSILAELQGRHNEAAEFSDPAGVKLLRTSGDEVTSNDLLARFRIPRESSDVNFFMAGAFTCLPGVLHTTRRPDEIVQLEPAESH